MNHDKLTRVLDVVVSTSSIVGAIIMAQGYWEGYWFFLVANISGIALQYKVDLKWSLMRNCIFLCTTSYGIYNTLL